jgi:dGTPase
MPLAPYAMDVLRTRGRRYPEPKHPYRNDYARDRDRVIHSRAFRRLESKTQVFTTRFSDHFRNRLTHTLEVAQVARTVAGALNLNTDLAEALALVHDIGHPPFGHAGERALDERMRAYGSRFNHNLHALHIVEHFEQRYLDFPGLNLTWEVREGIVKHSRDYDDQKNFPELAEYALQSRPPLEAQLIDLVDEIAYNTADLDDAYEAHLIDLDLLRAEVPMFAEAWLAIDITHPDGRTKLKFNEALKSVLNRLATDLIEHTNLQLRTHDIQTIEEVRAHKRRLAGLSPPVARMNGDLKRFLFARVYSNAAIAEERDRSVAALNELFTFYMDYPERMPKQHAELAENAPTHRIVCDYIAGMTDHYLLRQHASMLHRSTPQHDQ